MWIDARYDDYDIEDYAREYLSRFFFSGKTRQGKVTPKAGTYGVYIQKYWQQKSDPYRGALQIWFLVKQVNLGT